MARDCGPSVSTVQRIWRAFGLKPHRQEPFKLSTDPDFVAKVRDVVGLYLSPPEHALMLCVDEKSQIQVRVPVDRDHWFRLIVIIQSVRPVDRDHRFR
jgi:hypothetical protein